MSAAQEDFTGTTRTGGVLRLCSLIHGWIQDAPGYFQTAQTQNNQSSHLQAEHYPPPILTPVKHGCQGEEWARNKNEEEERQVEAGNEIPPHPL